MIALLDVCFHYDSSRDVLKDLCLTIEKQSSIAIVGNSGCGKTTLLNLIAGILKPNEGRVQVLARSLSYLMQDVTLLPYKTALENSLLAYSLRNHSFDEGIVEEAKRVLRLFQLKDDSFRKFPNELSGGMKQRIGLVQTILTDSELLLLDEPFNAIDRNALEVIESYIWDYVKQRKKTMVLVTHNLEQALMLCDGILVLGDGFSIRWVNPSDEFLALPPAQREKTDEYKQLFFETIEKMKS